MRRYFTPTVLAAVMVVGLAAIVGAQFPGGGRGMQGQGMGQGMGPGMRPGMGQGRGMMGGPEMGPGRGGPMAALKLTPEQRKQIQELQEKHRGANEPAANTLRGLHEKLRQALFSDIPGSALDVANEIAQLEAQLLPSRVALQIEIVKLLDSDQKKIAMKTGLFGPQGMMQGQMGPGGRRGMRGGRGGQLPVKK